MGIRHSDVVESVFVSLPAYLSSRSMSIMATLEAQSAAEAAAAELRQMSRSPNPTYGRDFAIERRIGKGQFSVVYRATCQALVMSLPSKKMMDAKSRLDCMKE